MNIYIASSWRNQHAVEMLTATLRQSGHVVHSFVDQAVSDEGRGGLDVEFGGGVNWIWSQEGARKFKFDTDGATKSNLVIYVGPSGCDAWAEVGAAWSRGIPVLGLWAKAEQAGLMRLMVRWFRSYPELLFAVGEYSNHSEIEKEPVLS